MFDKYKCSCSSLNNQSVKMSMNTLGEGLSHVYAEVNRSKKQAMLSNQASNATIDSTGDGIDGAMKLTVRNDRQQDDLSLSNVANSPSLMISGPEVKVGGKNIWSIIFTFLISGTLLALVSTQIVICFEIIELKQPSMEFMAYTVSQNQSEQLLSEIKKQINGTLQNVFQENLFSNIHENGMKDLKESRSLYEEQHDIQMDSSICANILHRNPSSPSGYYQVVSNCTGITRLAYCDMSLTCGGITGGWMRIAQLDLQHCPTGFTNTSFNGAQTCIPQNQSSGCTSVSFNTSGIPYSKVCGRIRGYGIGTVDGFYESGMIRGSSVEDNYLDGVSITSSGTHVWSFVAGICGRACLLQHRLGFVGDDFSCESSGCSSDNTCASSLWDQDDCRVAMPFFFKTLSTSTSADVTMSVCRDEIRDNEDIALTEAQLYVY